MNTYGYVRVSAADQNEDRQLLAMRERVSPEKNIYTDKQSGKAFVVLKPGKNEALAKKEIPEICRKQLPTYMIPEEIEFLNSLPRTARGKIDYRALEKLASE